MFESLPGFRDFYPDQFALFNRIIEKWKQTARCFGFVAYDAPVLEPLELYKEKSGEEVVGQLFTFTDKGGREVALRPEMTPSLARLAGSRANSLKRPVKWFHTGQHYRYEKPQKGRTRAFHQFNADILGEPSTAADAEIIALCIESMASFGLTADDVVIKISDRTLWMEYLSSLGINGEQALQILGIIDKMEREARPEILGKLRVHFADAAEDFLLKLDTLIKIRSLNDLNEFMLGHAPHADIKQRLQGRLNDWNTLFANLEAMGLSDFVEVNLGIVRGLAYYTGFVFEAFERSGKSRALGGGGRYDTLVGKMGYPAMAATGLAMGDVTLADLLEDKGLLLADACTPDIYVVIGSNQDERQVALADIMTLRRNGLRVEYSLKELGISKQFKLADKSGAGIALVYGSEEVAADQVKLRDLARRSEETTVPRVEIVELLRERLGRPSVDGSGSGAQ